MRGKTEKARGAAVRASRAKTRVAARRKLNLPDRDPLFATALRRHGPQAPPPAGDAAEPGRGRTKAASGGKAHAGRRRSGKGKEETPAREKGRACLKAGDDAGAERKGRDGREATGARAVRNAPRAGRGRGMRRRPAEAEGSAAGKEGARGDERFHRASDETAVENREAPTARRRRVPLRTALLGTSLLASLAALAWVYTGTGVLNVRHVEVRGNEVLDGGYLRGLSGITADTNLIKMDVKAVESAILSEPYVEEVDVSRRFPATVVLDVKERTPIGMIFQNGRYTTVDADGMLLEGLADRPPSILELKGLDVPLLIPGNRLEGDDFGSIAALVLSLPPEMAVLSSAAGTSGGEGLYLESCGTRVIYGDGTELERKNLIAGLSLRGLMDHYSAVEYIDVSYPDRPVIKPM